WGLLRDSLDLALDAVPAGVPVDEVQACLEQAPGVLSLHDLHVWGMSTTETALTAHLVVVESPTEERFLAELSEQLHDRFVIEHVTVQLERVDSEYFCPLESAHGATQPMAEALSGGSHPVAEG